MVIREIRVFRGLKIWVIWLLNWWWSVARVIGLDTHRVTLQAIHGRGTQRAMFWFL